MTCPDINEKWTNLGNIPEWLDYILMRDKIKPMANNKWSEYDIG